MQQADKEKNEPEQPYTPDEGTGYIAIRNLEMQTPHRKAVGYLLKVLALQLMLFGLLACYVHVHPILPLDIAITHAFQQNQNSWRASLCGAISYPGSSPC